MIGSGAGRDRDGRRHAARIEGLIAALLTGRRVREPAGVEHRLHDLRHFYASGLINAGCDVVTVQRALGHSNPSVTLNTYGHLWPDANDRTRQAARDVYALCTAYPVRTGDAKKASELHV